MSAFEKLRQVAREATSRRRRVRLQLACMGTSPQGNPEFLRWVPMTRDAPKREWVEAIVAVAEDFPHHEDVIYKLHVTRTNCAAFGETMLDVTEYLRDINLGR